LATQRLGLRSDREILASRSQATERTQFTDLDRALLRRADARGIVSYREPLPRPGPRRELYTHELRRLQFLEDAGLADKIGTRTWRLRPGMETALRQAQLAGDITKSRARHLAHLSDPRMPLVVTQLQVGAHVTGRLVGGGWADELQEQRYLMLEGTDGHLHYILQPPSTERVSVPRQLRVGDLVTLTRKAYVQQGRQTMQTEIRAIEIMQSIDGLMVRGRLLGYARGQDKQRYAVVDTGREAIAFRTEDAEIAAGREVRATCHRVDNDRRQRLVWRLGDEERERQRGRER